jgi:hypothetical protein
VDVRGCEHTVAFVPANMTQSVLWSPVGLNKTTVLYSEECLGGMPVLYLCFQVVLSLTSSARL